MVNLGALTAEISLGGFGHPSKFERVLRLGVVTTPMSLKGQPNFAQCLAVFWAATLYIQFLGAFVLYHNFARCKIHSASKSCVLQYWQRYCTALKQWALAKLCGVVSSHDRVAIPFDIRTV